MLKRRIRSIRLLCGLFFAISASTAMATSTQPINGIIAVVNTQLITRADFQQALQQTMAQYYHSQTPLPDAKTLKDKTLDMLINRTLVLQMAEQNHVTVSDADLNAAMGRIASQNHISLTELKKQISQGPDGMTIARFEKQLRDQLTLTKIEMQAVGQQTVTPADLNAMREKISHNPAVSTVHLKDLLIPLDDNASDKTRKTIQIQIQWATEQIKQHTSLTALADHMTAQGIESAIHDLGERTPIDLPGLFLSALSHAKPGEIVGPIAAPNGYHFLYVISEQSHAPHITDEQLHQLAYEQKVQTAIDKWVASLRKTAYVQINEPL